MAFNSNGLSLIAQRVGTAYGRLWLYSSTDPFDTVLAADYFTDGGLYGVKAGDQVIVHDQTSGVSITAFASAIASDDDDLTLSVNKVQELTESGAVDANSNVIELNHATVVIAATIADFGVYAGRIVIVKDTSASGTAAHTLTLTGGTFDGSNNVATLNAPGEQLVVLVGDDGNGTILQNTGSVALS